MDKTGKGMDFELFTGEGKSIKNLPMIQLKSSEFKPTKKINPTAISGKGIFKSLK